MRSQPLVVTRFAATPPSQHPTRMSSIPKSFHEGLPEQVAKKARVYYKDVPQEVLDELWGIFRGALALQLLSGPSRDDLSACS